LLSGKLLLIVAIHPLVGSRANRLSRVEPSEGAAQTHTRWGSSKPRAPLKYPICELPWGRIKNPLQHLVRLQQSLIVSSIASAAPSCLPCRETRKSNKKSTTTQRSSASRMQLSSNALESHSISLKMCKSYPQTLDIFYL
jgi:hypothetical protein